ncbi:MAG: hypothetical protein K6C35_08610 [Eubacterium sp.]|nr:hypothetical protein [Eubacterium sp.]SEF76568.1 hypothetical protein SAMN04487934_10353 [Eubacterium ruminantium]
MCLIITAIAAIVSALIWYFKLNDPKYQFSTLVLMYTGAALMWCVDGIFAVSEGEGFFDLSANDALLGLVVVVCGAAFWVIKLMISDPNGVFKKRLAEKVK